MTSENFNKWCGSKDGFYPRCKPCKRQDNLAYDERNRESRRLYQVEYRKKNQKKVVDYQKKYNEALPAGIYLITNTINNTHYVGASTQLKIRFRNHKLKLKKKTHCNLKLQEDYDRYGLEVFQFKILEEHPVNTPVETLEEREVEEIKRRLTEGQSLYNKVQYRSK